MVSWVAEAIQEHQYQSSADQGSQGPVRKVGSGPCTVYNRSGGK